MTTEHDKNEKDQELMSQLANKLATTAEQLTDAARRLQTAEITYREYLVRLRTLDQHMRNLIDLLQGSKPDEQPVEETNPLFCEPPPPPAPANPVPSHRRLRYADYIEFSNYAELKKFEKLTEITDQDIRDCDADDLMRKLLQDDRPK